MTNHTPDSLIQMFAERKRLEWSAASDAPATEGATFHITKKQADWVLGLASPGRTTRQAEGAITLDGQTVTWRLYQFSKRRNNGAGQVSLQRQAEAPQSLYVLRGFDQRGQFFETAPHDQYSVEAWRDEMAAKGCTELEVVPTDAEPEDYAEFPYDGDCAYCRRGRAHTVGQHDAQILRNLEASAPDDGYDAADRWRVEA